MVAQLSTHEKSHGPPFVIVAMQDGNYAAFSMQCDLLAHGASWQAVEQAVRNERPDARRLGIVRSVVGEGRY